MGNTIKKFIALLVIQFLILLLIPTLSMADSSNDSSISCRLSVISPDGNTPYNNTLPLNINMAWIANTVVPFMYFNISYAIDDGAKISIAQGNNPSFNSTAQGTALHYEYLVFPPSTTNTAITIEISTLTNGAHKITIFADGEYNLNNDFINPYHYTSSPIYFSVNYLAAYPTATPIPTPTPTPTLTPSPSPPEFTAKFVASSIEVTIKNQPITANVDTNSSSPSLYYGFRFKDNNATIPDWYYAPIYYVGISSYGTYYKASASDYTIVSFPIENYPLKYILNSGRIGMQVMTLIGNEVPTNEQNGTVYGFDGVWSGWSDVQTITIPVSSSSPTATSTASIQGWVAAVTLVVVLAMAAGLLVYLKKRRPKSGGKT